LLNNWILIDHRVCVVQNKDQTSKIKYSFVSTIIFYSSSTSKLFKLQVPKTFVSCSPIVPPKIVKQLDFNRS
jgi:hypothetical protein